VHTSILGATSKRKEEQRPGLLRGRQDVPAVQVLAVRAHAQQLREGQDGGGPSECDSAYHSDGEKVVALSTGWFSNMARCGHRIKVSANGNSVYAKVVDECDSVHGCDD